MSALSFSANKRNCNCEETKCSLSPQAIIFHAADEAETEFVYCTVETVAAPERASGRSTSRKI